MSLVYGALFGGYLKTFYGVNGRGDFLNLVVSYGVGKGG